jgi:S-adenosylmethionine synthetase
VTVGSDTNIEILSITAPSVEDEYYELVERKGVGHPATVCDAIAERASRYYSQFCLQAFGKIAHHSIDEVAIFNGEAVVDFGKGELITPYVVVVLGRAAFRMGMQEIPLGDLVARAVRDVMTEVSTGFDADRHLKVECRIVDHLGAERMGLRYRPETSRDLVAIGQTGLMVNDCLVYGRAPFSRLERLVLEAERLVNGPTFKAGNPDTCWDVRVVGSRHGEKFRLNVDMPFLARGVHSWGQYRRRKDECREQILSHLEELLGIVPELVLNPRDRSGRPYLSVLGLAAAGEGATVGRGNRINGLISPTRAGGTVAPAGKSPLDDASKLYGILADQLANRIHRLLGSEAEIRIYSSPDTPLGRPDEVVVRLRGWKGDPETDYRVRAEVEKMLSSVSELTREMIYSGMTLW